MLQRRWVLALVLVLVALVLVVQPVGSVARATSTGFLTCVVVNGNVVDAVTFHNQDGSLIGNGDVYMYSCNGAGSGWDYVSSSFTGGYAYTKIVYHHDASGPLVLRDCTQYVSEGGNFYCATVLPIPRY